MKDEKQPPSGSSGAIAAVAIAAAMLVLIGLLVLVVGAVWLVRTTQSRRHAVMQLERALVAEQQAQQLSARLEIERKQALAAAERMKATVDQAIAEQDMQLPWPGQTDQRQITIKLDKDGKIEVDGEMMERNALQAKLRDSSESENGALAVVVRADNQCLFAHVAVVLSLCQQAGITNVRVASLQELAEDRESATAQPDDPR